MTDGVAGAVGGMLRAAFVALQIVRPPRPIHAHGLVLSGHISWFARSTVSGIEWIDSPAGTREPVVGRLSRSLGLPSVLPDVIGLALRIDSGGMPVDIELASTGLRVPSRFLLVPRRSPSRARYTTLLPYRAPAGDPILLGAWPVAGDVLPADGDELAQALAARRWRLRLYHATPTGKWHPFAELTLGLADDQHDDHLRFDSVRHSLPGARTYPWVRALRQPSYERIQCRTGART